MIAIVVSMMTCVMYEVWLMVLCARMVLMIEVKVSVVNYVLKI